MGFAGAGFRALLEEGGSAQDLRIGAQFSGDRAIAVGRALAEARRLIARMPDHSRPSPNSANEVFSVEEVFAALARLSEVRVLEDEGDGEDEEAGSGSTKPAKANAASGKKTATGAGEKPFRNKDKGSGSELAEPVPLPEVEGGTENVSGDAATEKAAFLRVKTLAGYGAAKDWRRSQDRPRPLARRQAALERDEHAALLSGRPGRARRPSPKAL